MSTEVAASVPVRTAMHVQVVGSGPAEPQPDTPSSGMLVVSGEDRLLIDCGPGTISRLRRTLDPRTLSAVVVTHFHADHYLDLVALRYLFPWREAPARPLAVHVPEGGAGRLAALAGLINERPSFFSEAFDIVEYDSEDVIAVGGMRVGFVAARHYVPAWSVRVVDPLGAVLAYTGDTGPCEALHVVARDADLLVIEATLARPEDDDEARGHLAIGEALEVGRIARARRLLITHYPSEQRAGIAAAIRGSYPPAIVARPGLRLAVRRADADATR